MDGISESRLVDVWQHQLPYGTALVTEDGAPLRVIYPGRANDDRGADLRDAIIDTGRGLVRGDIEVHVKSSNWHLHRHHLDPAYNSVILHLVFQRDTESATILQNGEKVPMLVLERYMKGRRAGAVSAPGMPCQRLPHCSRSQAAEFLDSAGDERFLARAAQFRKELAQTEADEVLYQGIMGVLGYAKNKMPCLELARRLPLRILKSVVIDTTSHEECLARQQALLLGTAGLLPSQRSGRLACPDDRVERLERLWASSPQPAAIPETDWHVFKVRPSNLPQRRLAAVSYLLLHYREKGILEGIMDELVKAPDSGGALAKIVMVTARDYWADHYDFSLPIRGQVPALIGEARAADIMVNVLLPFAFAWGGPSLSERALGLCHHYPRLAVNTVERHMRRQLKLDGRLVNSARRQQGLLHIYKTLCSQGKCAQCPWPK